MNQPRRTKTAIFQENTPTTSEKGLCFKNQFVNGEAEKRKKRNCGGKKYGTCGKAETGFKASGSSVFSDPTRVGKCGKANRGQT
jgi:hypothetical protein